MKQYEGSKKKRIIALAIGLSMSFALVLAGCGPTKDDGGTVDPPPQVENPPEVKPKPEEYELTYRSGYTPTRFSGVQGEVTDLAEGVHLVKNKMTLSNGNVSVVYTLEVNLNYAGIAAGTKDNVSYGFNWAKTTPYKMAQAWETANTGEQVYASINADFFGSYSVNAFAKDGYIIKAGHNDNGGYDYKDDANDVPASAPMLFGVNGTKAQLAPIIKVDGDPKDAAVKEQLIKSELFYKVAGNKKCAVKENAETSDQYITIQTAATEPTISASGVAVKVDTSKGFQNLKVLEKMDKITSSTKGLAGGDGYAWLICTGVVADGVTYLKGLKVGDSISLTVASADGTWDGYNTILGTRQALVLNNAIAPTITLENTNGAQTKDIPRTAVGIKEGRVVIFAVESLFYYVNRPNVNVNGYEINPETDFHGMNLPELAEFAYYYGCSVAANFDGGGSTQLITKAKGGEAKTIVRSADTFSWGLNDTRVVMNGLLVTSKKA